MSFDRERREQTRRKNLQYRLRKLLQRARRRAEASGLEFNIDYSDLVVSETCPVLGIPLGYTDGTPLANRFSLDRTDSSKGYVKGNIAIISFRANTLKSNGTADEFDRVAAYVRFQEIIA